MVSLASRAAYYAQKNALNAQITLLEASNRWGGKISTDRVPFDNTPHHLRGNGDFIIEGGPDTFLATKP